MAQLLLYSVETDGYVIDAATGVARESEAAGTECAYDVDTGATVSAVRVVGPGSDVDWESVSARLVVAVPPDNAVKVALQTEQPRDLFY